MLPRLPAHETITEPAIAEKNFDSWFLKRLNLRADTNIANIEFKCSRYDYIQKEISSKSIDASKNAYTEVQKWQCWKDAMSAILNCVSLEAQRMEIIQELRVKRKEKKAMEEGADTTELDEQIATLEATKDSIETSMGPLDSTN